MTRPVLVDVTRLLTRLRYRAPTGIDRVDLAYARRFLDGRPDRQAVALTRFGPRLLPAEAASRLVATLEARWRAPAASAGDAEDPATARIRAWLAADPAPPPPAPAPGRTGWALPASALLPVRALRWRDAEAAPQGAAYLHTSHLRLDLPERFGWLARRPDIRPVFYVHDLIPIEFPEYMVPGEAGRHRTRMATVARYAAAVLTNTRDVADRFAAHLAREGLPGVVATPAAIGIEDGFAARPEPFRASRPYFVVCSTIEARKNHLLLLQVWRDLARRLGDRTPALVVVGRRGWESEGAADLLDRCVAIRPHVIEASGLPTADLAALMAGAQALLTPSFAEGYGIPVVEALAVGTPVIASDLPAHREVAGGLATLLDPLDGPAWREAVLEAAARPPGTRHVGGFRPPGWTRHFDIVDHVLASL